MALAKVALDHAPAHGAAGSFLSGPHDKRIVILIADQEMNPDSVFQAADAAVVEDHMVLLDGQHRLEAQGEILNSDDVVGVNIERRGQCLGVWQRQGTRLIAAHDVVWSASGSRRRCGRCGRRHCRLRLNRARHYLSGARLDVTVRVRWLKRRIQTTARLKWSSVGIVRIHGVTSFISLLRYHSLRIDRCLCFPHLTSVWLAARE